MENFLKTTGVAVCGLITSVLVAIIVTLAYNLFELNIFTFSMWVVFPVGAIGTGMAAASGYYFGSLYFHKRPNIILFLQMLLIAAFTQILIYYLEYSTFVLDNGMKASDIVPFAQYLDISLTKAHYRIGRGMHDTGEVGEFGYWLAIFQFIGFMLGGIAVYFILLDRPECKQCKKYFRPLASKNKNFFSTEDFAEYYDNIFQHPFDLENFAKKIKQVFSAKPSKGAILLEEKLHGCPQCKSQMVSNKVKVYNGESWNDVNKLTRHILMPNDVNLVDVFKST